MAISAEQSKLLLFELVDKMLRYKELVERAVEGGGDGGDVFEAEEAGKDVDKYLEYIKELMK